MLLKQISVFVENRKGRLAKLTTALGDNNIDLIALSIADTTNFGILRCIVKDSDHALKIIKEAGFTAKTTEVLAVEVPDRPGGLAHVLTVLDENEVDIEYLYSFVTAITDNALILFRVEELERTIEVLTKNDIRIMTSKEVYGI
jgi:hypothetical protein